MNRITEDNEEDGPYPGEECGRWDNGKLMKYCTKAGSEECDFECPFRADFMTPNAELSGRGLGPGGRVDPLVGRLRLLEIDHDPDGWPAVQMRDITRILNALEFYRGRCDLLQREQARMRDPERTLVCDVLANGQLLPDPDGVRYGPPNAVLSGKPPHDEL